MTSEELEIEYQKIKKQSQQDYRDLFGKEMKSFRKQFEALKLERDALWVKTQEDERIINDLRDAVNQKLIQRTELLAIAEEMAEVIIGNGASVKDAVPIDKLDEFYKKWSIGEPFVRDYKA